MSHHTPCRAVILISGRGSNLQSLIRYAETAKSACQIAAVISNKPNAGGLQIAQGHDIETRCVDHTQYDSREAFDSELARVIDEFEPDLVILAGFMRILTEQFTRHYAGKMLNIHPSLLPLYPGLHTHRRALENQDQQHGATIHFVTPELDGGPLVIQSQLEINASDDEQSLAQRVLETEHIIYPLAVDWFARGLLKIVKSRVHLCEQMLESPVIYSNRSLKGIDETWETQLLETIDIPH